MLTAWCLAHSVINFLPSVATLAFKCHAIFFCLVILFSLSLTTLTPHKVDRNIFLFMNATVEKNVTPWYNSNRHAGHGVVTPYPVCNMRWGNLDHEDNEGLTILDFAALSHYAYASDNHLDSLHSFTNASFKEDAEVVFVNAFSDVPRLVATRFSGPAGTNGTVVLAVKGTSTVEEIFTDAGFWTGIYIMQIINAVVPLLNNIPSAFIAWILDAVQLPSAKASREAIIETIVNKVNELQAEYPRDEIILTGHSLGGGLAEIASARSGVSSVVLSGIGNYFSENKFGYKTGETYRNVVSIVPDSDLIPRIDKHVDMHQRIQCIGPNGKPRSALSCHGVFVSACEIWRVCGDVKGRDFTGLCLGTANPASKPTVNESCLGKAFGQGNCP